MQKDFHYFATYCAAYLAGYTHEESCGIACSAQRVDECSPAFINMLEAPAAAVTTQMQVELMDANTDVTGLQSITRIWASFHFLPQDLYAKRKKCSKKYLDKYRLLCGPNGTLVKDTVETAKGRGLQAAGLAMHVLADTWAHRYFAGTPSLVINNTDHYFYEIFPDGTEKQIKFRHSPMQPDDVENGVYSNSIFQTGEKSVMNLGHGRAGHLPDYSFCRYKYLPAWGGYNEIVKDNPSDYYNAFCQMIYAMKYLGGGTDAFETGVYDREAVRGYEEEIREIITTRRINAEEAWRAFGEKLSGQPVPDHNTEGFQREYRGAAKEKKPDTFLGKFFTAATAQKSMVTNRIYKSGNMLAGYSVSPESSVWRRVMDKLAKAGEGHE